ncbi:Aste57867_25217 [Aphanomyces stellatus]|uniref:Aste57867_25217 protein n=1 Tax=Aphanomyces stellatus TaxID=120398 RepID=A0A485LSI7_9STRA|nr:hypothetical protein As57867_025139 [Aphanomyces stellatus]VFU01844.1 Aste57867_25217 [Aphanomyces stellatus]
MDTTSTISDVDDLANFLKEGMFDEEFDWSDHGSDDSSTIPQDAAALASSSSATDDDSEKTIHYLERLYAMLEHCPATVAMWTHDGQAFAILDSKALEATYLPQFFKSIKFESFCRQLNAYRFQKTKRPDLAQGSSIVLEFRHPHFVQGQPEKLHLIHRRRRICKLKAKAIDGMNAADLRHTLAEVVSYVHTLQSELEETKGIVETLLTNTK